MILPKPYYNEAACGAALQEVANTPRVTPAGGRNVLCLSEVGLGILLLVAAAGPLRGGTINLPNSSFESPATDYAYPLIDSWQQVPAGTFQSGVFSNQPPADVTHIDNCDGAQGAFLFASNQVAILQDYDSTDWMNPTPTHAFNAMFEVGKSYTLTIGVIGGTNLAIPMQEGTRLELSFYYRDDASNMVAVAATTITNSGTLFPHGRHFIDFEVRVPAVEASDPWAGRHIGVKLESLVTAALEGGYWDIDNVRLSSTVPTSLAGSSWTNGQFGFTLQSEPGLRFEILATTNLSLALSNWTSLGTVTNVTGTVPFVDPAASFEGRFYRARQLP